MPPPPQNAAARARRALERAPRNAGVWLIRRSRHDDIVLRFSGESRSGTKSNPVRFTYSRSGPKLLGEVGLKAAEIHRLRAEAAAATPRPNERFSFSLLKRTA